MSKETRASIGRRAANRATRATLACRLTSRPIAEGMARQRRAGREELLCARPDTWQEPHQGEHLSRSRDVDGSAFLLVEGFREGFRRIASPWSVDRRRARTMVNPRRFAV